MTLELLWFCCIAVALIFICVWMYFTDKLVKEFAKELSRQHSIICTHYSEFNKDLLEWRREFYKKLEAKNPPKIMDEDEWDVLLKEIRKHVPGENK